MPQFASYLSSFQTDPNEIKQFFLNHYSLKNREQVTQVVMDLNAQYQTVIRYLFPNA
ncbi:transposase, partial [Levilactobacillus brevis]|uniref:transposase n=1 Tax=Levilactobacillus brevis TaxID=1580 RepID=UPI003D9A92EB